MVIIYNAKENMWLVGCWANDQYGNNIFYEYDRFKEQSRAGECLHWLNGGSND